MNDVSELTKERAGYAAAIGEAAMLEMKIVSCVAEHRRLTAASVDAGKRADAHRARIHEIELGDATGNVIPPAQGVTMVDYKAPATIPPPAAPALPNGSGEGQH